jgi:hypothetical protein
MAKKPKISWVKSIKFTRKTIGRKPFRGAPVTNDGLFTPPEGKEEMRRLREDELRFKRNVLKPDLR